MNSKIFWSITHSRYLALTMVRKCATNCSLIRVRPTWWFWVLTRASRSSSVSSPRILKFGVKSSASCSTTPRPCGGCRSDGLMNWTRRMGASAVARFESEAPGHRQALQQTLDSGSFRLVIAVDAINNALQRMMEYLNSVSANASVIAVEYSRLRHGSVELLLPKVYGEELAIAKEATKASADGRERKLWTSDLVRSVLEARDQGAVAVFDAFVRAITQSGLEFEGKPALDPLGDVVVKDSEAGRAGEITVIFYPPATTKLELNFTPSAKFLSSSAKTRVEALLERIGSLASFSGAIAEIRQKGIAHRRPNLFLEDLSTEDVASLVALVAAFNGN